jgi:crotonobetainyl-CoA:carnitine CoA-transferase CaiB-like acyl-CoA transferase
MMVGAMADDLSDLEWWAASGAMWLTGRADGPPLGPPARLVPGARTVAVRLAAAHPRLAAVDPLALLGERAAEAGTVRDGARSCGGATSLLRAADGWLALTLARDDDADLLPAWLGLDAVPALEDRWAVVGGAVAGRRLEGLVEAGIELGLPLGAVPAPSPAVDPVARTTVGAAAARSVEGALVVDLGSLWAGPLCGSLLAMAGADVVKVESTGRPDGARQGPPGFFDVLNAGKRSVGLDLGSRAGRTALRDLIARADVVIEASRPRALQQLGVDAEALLAAPGGPTTWVSITGHGRVGDAALRVGFGDDAAAAGGLVVWDDGGPCFCAAAVADPLTGLTAAVEAIESLARPGAELLDVALSRVAGSMAGPTLDVPPDLVAAPPRARAAPAKAAPLGEHTAEVLAATGVSDPWA